MMNRALRQRTVRRRGTIFPYYLVYMMLTATLLTATGICLHSLLKASQSGSDFAFQLSTLVRLESSLRNDVNTCGNLVQTADNSFEVASDEQQIAWQFDGNVVTRTTSTNGTVNSREPFVLAAHSTVQLIPQPHNQWLTVRITAPVDSSQSSSTQNNPTTPDDNIPVNAVEVLLPLSTDQTKPPADAQPERPAEAAPTASESTTEDAA
jgi:hypothetical protein